MQINNIKISVIIPIYNVGNFLKKSIESILAQTFTDFNLYLVDDGSTDASLDICNHYANIDKRIIVIHQENSGAYAARNNALKRIDSEYVCFFDGDDYIDKNMLFDLYNLATTYNANLVVSGFYIETFYNDNDFITLDYIPDTFNNNIDFYDSKEKFRKYAYKNFDHNMFYSPWNKLYNVKYLKSNNIVFPNVYRDDFPFVLSVIKDIDKVVITKKQYYHFIRKRTDSETQKYVANLYEKREEEHKLMLDLYKHWNLINDKNSNEMIARRYIDRIIECMVNLFNKECTLSKKEKIDKIKVFLENEYLKFSIKLAKPLTLYLKFMYFPLYIKNAYICYEMSKFINFIKKKNTKLFSVLKTNR